MKALLSKKTGIGRFFRAIRLSYLQGTRPNQDKNEMWAW